MTAPGVDRWPSTIASRWPRSAGSDARSISARVPSASSSRRLRPCWMTLACRTEVWPIPGATPFSDDDEHSSYDRAAVERFWRALIEMERVFKVFGSRFVAQRPLGR